MLFLTPIQRSRDMANGQCCMAFNTGLSTMLADNSSYVDRS